jgi:hypothetical protein
MKEIKTGFCYHHLHDSAHGKSIAKRVNGREVDVSLPNDKIRSYTLYIDVRDPRVLICFDGDIPSGGLPKGSTVLMSVPVVSTLVSSPISCHMAKVYKRREPDEDPPLYSIVGDRAEQKLYHRFVLLKTGRAIFRKYTNSLQPKYLIVDIHDGIAEFSTSSY